MAVGTVSMTPRNDEDGRCVPATYVPDKDGPQESKQETQRTELQGDGLPRFLDLAREPNPDCVATD